MTDGTNDPIKLGETYTDTITGFSGVATARYEFLYGCVRVQLEGRSGDSGDPKELVFDEQRLVVGALPTGATPRPTATSGGPRSGPPSRDPQR
jgi:hypothetical protein